MKTNAHTPGPWTFIDSGTENACVHIDEGCVVGGVYRGCDSDLLSHADARLIAAAPELLAFANECAAMFAVVSVLIETNSASQAPRSAKACEELCAKGYKLVHKATEGTA